MRKLVLMTLACCLLVTAAAGDVIWLQNGKRYEGKVTRKGAKVTIELAYGTIEVDAGDVLRIVKAEPIRPKPKDPVTTVKTPSSDPFNIAQAAMPESVAFLFMRRIVSSPTGLGTADQREQLHRWRDAAHDRIRKAGTRWLTPKEFLVRRKSFDRYLSEALEIMRQRNRIRVLPGRTMKPADKIALQRIVLAAAAKMRSAAANWPDPPLRAFMTGVANYEGGGYVQAASSFRQAVELGPLVPAFNQGYALALKEADKATEALPYFIKALELAPESRYVLEDLREGMKAVAGVRTHTPVFQRAKELSGQYKTSTSSSGSHYSYKRTRWAIPGKFKQARDNTLPIPEYDRFAFRQGPALAVGKNGLLVDTQVVAGAEAVYVRVGDSYATAKARRSTFDWKGKGDPPVTILIVTDYNFTPVTVEAEAKFASGDAVFVDAMNLHTEMGGNIRRTTGKITSAAGGKIALDVVLLPGESAAPVVTTDNRMVGFIAARTDVSQPDGGSNRVLGLDVLSALALRAAKAKPSSYYSLTRRTVTPKDAKGTVFRVYGVFTEKLNKDADKRK